MAVAPLDSSSSASAPARSNISAISGWPEKGSSTECRNVRALNVANLTMLLRAGPESKYNKKCDNQYVGAYSTSNIHMMLSNKDYFHATLAFREIDHSTSEQKSSCSNNTASLCCQHQWRLA